MVGSTSTYLAVNMTADFVQHSQLLNLSAVEAHHKHDRPDAENDLLKELVVSEAVERYHL